MQTGLEIHRKILINSNVVTQMSHTHEATYILIIFFYWSTHLQYSCLYLQLLYNHSDNLSKQAVPQIFMQKKSKKWVPQHFSSLEYSVQISFFFIVCVKFFLNWKYTSIMQNRDKKWRPEEPVRKDGEG